MVWLAGGIALFLFFAWLGRQSRLGKVGAGPWINQFRALRSLIATALMVLGVTLLVRGQMWQGAAALLAAFVLGGTVRYQSYFRREGTPPEAGSYTTEEVAAYKTLGLAIGADRRAVKEAWKLKMKAAHPDQGGDTVKASALNAARDVLLKRRR